MLWLNSTLGTLIRIAHGNRPYLGRSGLTNSSARTMPMLDTSALSSRQLARGKRVFDELSGEPLLPFSHMDHDTTRASLDSKLMHQVLACMGSVAKDVRAFLANEPIVQGAQSVKSIEKHESSQGAVHCPESKPRRKRASG